MSNQKSAAYSVQKPSRNFVQVILEKYQSGANTTNISKFLQQELQIDPHEAGRAIKTRIIASKVSQEQGEKLQHKLKEYKVEVSLKTVM